MLQSETLGRDVLKKRVLHAANELTRLCEIGTIDGEPREKSPLRESKEPVDETSGETDPKGSGTSDGREDSGLDPTLYGVMKRSFEGKGLSTGTTAAQPVKLCEGERVVVFGQTTAGWALVAKQEVVHSTLDINALASQGELVYVPLAYLTITK